ncbi:hypothetical protein CC2G_003745 [Coprinopsis cinerea AmutBmut pab1-1]|nr:hypothetical protein CC2G_003745 [Coprinopsis cinerea AmutBmut pab1-1]
MQFNSGVYIDICIDVHGVIRVYLEASRSRAEKAENERLEELKRVREETLAQKQQLEHKAEEYKRIKNELSSLYATIFDGPTPPFPEEDTFEHTLLTTHLHTESAQKDLNRHTHTSTLLQSALLALTISISLMKDVLRTSSGTIGFLHTSDGHSVQEAAKRFVEAQGYAEKARERCREVQRLKGICVGDMPFLAFAKSDRLRSDMYIYEKLATIARQLEDANDQIQRAHAESERRKVEAARVLAEVTSRRDTLELELFELRKSIVEKVIREDTEPPPYEPFENGRDG